MNDRKQAAASLAAPWMMEIIDATPAGRATLDLVSTACHAAIAQHSARVLRYALHIAGRERLDIDRAALTQACLMHDLGASGLAVGTERFEVQGADLAVRLLADHGWAPDRRHEVWLAIALHTSPHIAERLNPLTRAVRLGVRADFGEELVDPALRRATEAQHPRLQIERVLSAAVVEQALRDERRAPPATWPAALLTAHRVGQPDPDARLAAF